MILCTCADALFKQFEGKLGFYHKKQVFKELKSPTFHSAMQSDSEYIGFQFKSARNIRKSFLLFVLGSQQDIFLSLPMDVINSLREKFNV